MAKSKKSQTEKSKNTKQDLLYIMSNSCGWCKKSEPVVKELVDEGAKITTLDVQNPDDQKKINEVKQKYNAQCGTPFFIDAESGNQICGFREKDVLQKWVDGEEIPKPPQPKSPPPPPPSDVSTASEDEINKWKGEYEKWTGENDHLPNVLPFDQIKQRVQQAQEARKNNPQGGQVNAPSSPKQVGDYKVSINNKFYYVVIDGSRETVFADIEYINSLSQQYFQRESNGDLTKVVGDSNFNKNEAQSQQNNVKPINNQPKKDIDPKVKAQIEKLKKEQESNKKSNDKKSKKNKKTIKGL